MKVLVTGHLGLIGSEIYKNLNKIHEVDGIDRNDKIPSKKYDIIIHCAANCIIKDIISNPNLSSENINYTFQIMELVRKTKCKKLVIFSSSRVMHKEQNPYTVGKKYNEQICEAYKQCYGINYIIIRPETVWGEKDYPNKRAILIWINNALKNKPIIIYGNKNKELPPMHVNDFTKVFLKIFKEFIKNKNKQKIYFISGKIMKITDIIKTIKKLTNSKSEVIYKRKALTQPQICIKSQYSKYSQDFEKSLIKTIQKIKLLK